MPTDRSLWVEDKYALRCRGCNNKFTAFLRKHHCRLCGQVFCGGCLTRRTVHTRASLEQLPSRSDTYTESKSMKLCQQCAQNSAQQHQESSAGDSSEAAIAAASATAALYASYATARRSQSQSLPLTKASSSDVSKTAPSAIPTKSNSRGNPDVERDNWLGRLKDGGVGAVPHAETEEDRSVAYCISEVPQHHKTALERLLCKLGEEDKVSGKNVFVKREGDILWSARDKVEVEASMLHIPPLGVNSEQEIGVCTRFFASSSPAGSTVEGLDQFALDACHTLHERALYLLSLHEDVLGSWLAQRGLQCISKEREVSRLLCNATWTALTLTTVALGRNVLDHVNVTVDVAADHLQYFFAHVRQAVSFPHTMVSRRMPTRIANPKLLLLGGSVTVRASPSMELLEYVNSYEGILDKLFDRIHAMHPSLIVVEGSMHHYLQERIIEAGDISLLLHAGPLVVRQLALCCNAAVVADLQYLSATELQEVPLGTCEYVEVISSTNEGKPTCVFGGLPIPAITSVIFFGAPSAEAAEALKDVFEACIAAAYHMCAEAHFLTGFGLPLSSRERRSDSSGDDASSRDVRCCDTALTMNIGTQFPSCVMDLAAEHCELLRDSIVLNTVCLERGGEAPATGAAADTTPPTAAVLVSSLHHHSGETSSQLVGTGCGPEAPLPATTALGQQQASWAHQRREVLSFYGDGDEPLGAFLVSRLKEAPSRSIYVHESCKITVTSVTSTTMASQEKSLSQSMSTKKGTSSQRRSYMCWATNDEVVCYERAKQHAIAFDRSTMDYKSVAPREGCAEVGYASMARSWSASRFSSALCSMPPPYCFSERTPASLSAEASATAVLCTPHTLSMSLGALLELLIYGSQFRAHLCDSNNNKRDPLPLCLTFILFPSPSLETTITFCVSSLVLYAISMPPLVLPSLEKPPALITDTACEGDMQDDGSYLSMEKEELARDVRTLTALLDGEISRRKLCRQQKSEDTRANEQDEGSLEILKEEAQHLLKVVESTVTTSDIDLMRWELLKPLVTAISTLLVPSEASGGGGLVSLLAAVPAANDSRAKALVVDALGSIAKGWLYSPSDRAGIRLSEPCSVIAVVLRRMMLATFVPGDVPAASEQEDAVIAKYYPAAANATEGALATLQKASTASQPNPVAVFTLSFLTGIVYPSTHTSASTVSSNTTTGLLSATSPTSVKVEVLFPEEFAALQYLHTGGEPISLADSLARCLVHRTDGGKTKAGFFITADGRYLLKRVKAMELKHFCHLGPRYFAHMYVRYSRYSTASVHSHRCRETTADSWRFGIDGEDTVLAKALGLYTMYVSTSGGEAGEPQYFMLTENLVAGTQVDMTYDLKGSQRNRSSAIGAMVRLDTDLLQMTRAGEFFFVSTEAKSSLLECLTRDTQILSDSAVMDYSLMVAVQRERRRLHVGVIDYLHPYTGAKVLESKVKSGLDTVLGYGGRDPTIIDPASYQARFLKWVNTYFCGVPDKIFSVRRTIAAREKSLRRKMQADE